VQLWLERYILPICAAIVFGITILNPLRLDWQQRASLIITISALAYFVAHTLHRTKLADAGDSAKTISLLTQQVDNLQSQQKRFEDGQQRTAQEKQRRQTVRGKLAEFLKEGKNIQDGIEYSNLDSPRRKKEWEHRVEEYLTKNLDEGYAIRFRSPNRPLISYPDGMNMPMRAPFADISAKMGMLNEFISELRD